MAYGYMSNESNVGIEWDWDPEDDDYHVPFDLLKEVFEKFKANLMDDFMVHEEDWEEFVGGMSMMSDKVERITVTFTPCQGATIALIKHLCVKCNKTCGLASTYCDGTGKATENCQECGKTRDEGRHRDGCSWNR